MYDNSIRSVMRRRGIIKAEPDATVRKVTKQMARRNAGAVLVIDGDRLVGIFTERDAVFRVMAPGLDAAETRLRDVMTRNPVTIGPDRACAKRSHGIHIISFCVWAIEKSGFCTGSP